MVKPRELARRQRAMRRRQQKQSRLGRPLGARGVEPSLAHIKAHMRALLTGGVSPERCAELTNDRFGTPFTAEAIERWRRRKGFPTNALGNN